MQFLGGYLPFSACFCNVGVLLPPFFVANAAFTPLLRWWTYITFKSDRRIWWRAVYIWWRSLPWSCIPNFGFSTGMEITGDTPRSPFRFKRWVKFLIILSRYSRNVAMNCRSLRLFLRCGMERIPGFSPGIYIEQLDRFWNKFHTFFSIEQVSVLIHEVLSQWDEESQNRQDAHI